MNLFFVSSIILSFMSLLLGSLVYLKDRKSSLGKRWFALSVCIAGWAVLLYLVASSGSSITALRFQYLLDIVALGIPVTYFHFVTTFLGINASRQMRVVGGVAVLLALFSVTSLFKLGVVQKFDFYWINPGPFYLLFPVFFATVISYSLFLLIRAYRKEASGSILRSQIRYQILAGVIGFSGGATNFLPQIFNVFPFGNYFVLFYVFFISYSILKYNLFNLNLILVELAVLIFNLFLFFNVFTSGSRSLLILNALISAFVLVFSTFLLRSIYKDIRDREKIEALARDMAQANEKLHLLEQQKTEFVSIASHQLRTPLTVIKGYASMILEGTFGTLTDPAREAVGKLYKSSERIVALVEDLLTVSRIEQGRMMLRFETVNFAPVVQGVLAEMDEDIKKSNLQVSFTPEEGKEFPVSVDEKKFRQVVRHILDNAVAYTNAPGRVRITLADDRTVDKIRLTVSDTGVGMTAEQIKSIFERFNLKIQEQTTDNERQTTGEDADTTQRTDLREYPQGQTSNTGGGEEVEETPNQRTPGIGLYIAQEIIEAHHGTMRIESAGPNEGTTVVVELPRAK